MLNCLHVYLHTCILHLLYMGTLMHLHNKLSMTIHHKCVSDDSTPGSFTQPPLFISCAGIYSNHYCPVICTEDPLSLMSHWWVTVIFSSVIWVLIGYHCSYGQLAAVPVLLYLMLSLVRWCMFLCYPHG